MTIAIHQPNFFPYYGFFDKMFNSDKFILLNHCQFEKNNYQNRFNWNNQWFTMKVNGGLMPINEKKYIEYAEDWERLKIKIPYNLDEFDDCITENLAYTNSMIIKKIVKKIGIPTDVYSDFETNQKGTARLVEICKYYKADTYLSGISGGNYMDLKMFEDNNIKVIYQEKVPPVPIIEILYNGL